MSTGQRNWTAPKAPVKKKLGLESKNPPSDHRHDLAKKNGVRQTSYNAHHEPGAEPKEGDKDGDKPQYDSVLKIEWNSHWRPRNNIMAACDQKQHPHRQHHCAHVHTDTPTNIKEA